MLELKNLTRAYELGGERAGVFDVSLTVPKGCLAVLAGPSGSGKTTLLQLAGLLDTPDEGEVRLEGETVSSLPEKARCDLRLRRLGFVFQAFNLVPVLSALENVMLPLQLQGVAEAEAQARAEAALARVGLSDRAHHHPGQLSGGQQQRVAIARALAPEPWLVLADEPTASLDHAHGGPLMDLMGELAAERGVTFVVASHDPSVISRAHRVFRLLDGRLVQQD
ncbi:ABC transporter ATP-binding protein [Geothrix sp. PMB-07]|uniref:ABC transporter ATP-binding protein n=1 Tax=Geothrix sp. PMB-07 TaxID=3068640 RepID=UPI002740B723|nr:ABC transporter ATP-binding protein [Geothrix sp. PMB-07]WLT32222.1 ABC transporter ATP-binding protein [Geothrix sp. PMB-07]